MPACKMQDARYQNGLCSFYNGRMTVAEFTQLRRGPSLASQVTQSMLASISSGRFGAGDWLPSERELSEQFGVSRTVIREAVRGLEAKGLIEVRSGRGARIAAVNSDQISESLALFVNGAQSQQLLGPSEISEVRETLELRLVELACERASDADVALIAESLDAMAASPRSEDAAHYDAEFHRRIALATHNALFVALLESLNMVMTPIRERSLAVDGRRQATLDEHSRVLDAIEKRDPAAARRSMVDHLEGSRSYYVSPAQEDR